MSRVSASPPKATVDFQNLFGREGPILLKNLLVETVKAD
jgi:hypothetical protein